jgi:3-dehydroquinate synthetase
MARKPILHNGYSRKQILEILKKSQYARIRALLLIYSFQTDDEQDVKSTIHLNGVGFTGVHAPYLSSLAEQVQAWGLDLNMPKEEFKNLYKKIENDKATGKSKLGILSPKQLASVKKLIPQYYMQVWESISA